MGLGQGRPANALRSYAGLGRRRVVACKAVIAEPPKSESSSKTGPIILDGQVLHSLTPERLALVSTLGDFVENEVRAERRARRRRQSRRFRTSSDVMRAPPRSRPLHRRSRPC